MEENDDKVQQKSKDIAKNSAKKVSDSIARTTINMGKKSIKILSKEIVKILAVALKPLIPIILIAIIILILITSFIRILEEDDANSLTAYGKNSINTVLGISDISELVTINGTPQKGYSLAFVDDVDEKLEKVLKSDEQYKGYGITEVDTLKKYIKAELVTQLPYLGDGVSSSKLPNLDGVDILYEPEETTELLNSMQGILMIGDSFTDGIKPFFSNDGCFIHSQTGTSPSYWVDKVEEFESEDEVKGVCVLLGVNNPWQISDMKDLIDKIYEKYSNVPIYVQKVFPLGKNYRTPTMQEQIDKFNEEIQNYCENKENIYWIDTTSGLVDEVGYLISDDGLHPKDYQTLANNIKNKILRSIGESDSSDGELKGSNNKEAIWGYLISKGFSEEAAAGIMGNWEQESGYNSNNLQNGSNEKSGMSDEEFTNQVNSGTISKEEFIRSSIFGLNENNEYGYGLAQWTSAGRKQGLYDFAKEEQKDIDDLKMQLDYFMKELEDPAYASLLDDSFKNLSGGEESAVNAAVRFHTVYEQSKDSEEAVKSTRGGFAKNIYNELKGTIPSGTYSTGSSKKAMAVTDREVDEENVFQPAIKLRRVIPNKTIGDRVVANGIVTNMTYVPPGVFNAYLNQNNENVLDVFTINNNREIVFAKWTYEDGVTKYVKASSVDISTVMEKYTMPYDYIMMLNVYGGDVDFCLDLADLALESEYVIAVQDQVTTTHTKTEQDVIVERTIEAGIDAHGNQNYKTIKETRHYENEKQTEQVSENIELTYADSWAIKIENEKTYLNNDYVERENIEEINTDTTTTEGNTTTKIATSSIVNKYKSGKTTVYEDEAGDKFVEAYNNSKNFKLLEPDWLFESLNSNAKTTKLVDITKYLLYKATHESYGVEKPGDAFREYDENEFKEIKEENKGTIGWDFTRAWENNDLRKYMNDEGIDYDSSAYIYSCVTEDKTKYILHDEIGQSKENKIYGIDVITYDNEKSGEKWQNVDLFQEQGIDIKESEYNVYGESKIDVDLIDKISIQNAVNRTERVENIIKNVYKLDLEQNQIDCLADILYEKGNIYNIIRFIKNNEFDFENMTEEEIEDAKEKFQKEFEEFTGRRGEARWILLTEGRYCTPDGEELDPSNYFCGNGDILEACEAVTEMLRKRGARYSLSSNELISGDIDRSLNEGMYHCCATYVSEVLYYAGILSEEQINKFNYHYTKDIPNMLANAGWETVPIEDIQPGDVVNKPGDNGNGHVMIYAGDNLFWDQRTAVIGSDGSSPVNGPHTANLAGYTAWRPK